MGAGAFVQAAAAAGRGEGAAHPRQHHERAARRLCQPGCLVQGHARGRCFQRQQHPGAGGHAGRARRRRALREPELRPAGGLA